MLPTNRDKETCQMSFQRFVLVITCSLLVLGWAVTAQSKTYSLVGGGGQLQIGGGLPLPIQATNTLATGPIFPTLRVPAVTGAVITGTTAMAAQQKLNIPASVLSKLPAQLTLGQYAQNPNLYAVATNLGFVWPAAPAVLSTGARTGAKTTSFTTVGGGSIIYSNPLASKFGGPAQFALAPGAPSGLVPAAGVTLYGIGVPGPGNPPCVHTALTPTPFPVTGNAACVAGIAAALPTGLVAIGGPVGVVVITPGGTPSATTRTPTPGPVPGVGIGAFGPGPVKPAGALGTVSFFAFTPAGTMTGFTNMASSIGYPWTTGTVQVSQITADGAPEFFSIKGGDARNASGVGTIQLVSGALSQRTTSGPNANRGWVRLVLAAAPDVPALSPTMGVVAALVMLTTFGYAVRRFSTAAR
jgi:hypothetical protein